MRGLSSSQKMSSALVGSYGSLLLYLLTTLTMPTMISADVGEMDGEKKLFRDLLDDYEPAVRPRIFASEAVVVDIDFELNQIKELDEKREILQTIGFVEASWTDEYLTWDPANHSNIVQIVLPPDRIWLPDFGIENSAETFYDETFFNNFRVLVLHTGVTKWSFGGVFQTICDLDTTFYPFDIQTCNIRMENWAYSKSAVELQNGSATLHLDNYHPHGIWTLFSTRAYAQDVFFDTEPDEAFPLVVFQLNLMRKPRYYVVNIMIPCIFLTSIALMVYVLPPESGEKVSLGVTVLLAFSVFQFVIADNTPVNSDCTPLLSIFVAVTMGMSTLSVATTVVVLQLHNQCSATAVPRLIQVIFFNYISRLVFLKEYCPSNGKTTVDIGNKANDGNVDGVELKVVSNHNDPHVEDDVNKGSVTSHQSSGGSKMAENGEFERRLEGELRQARANLDHVRSYVDMMSSRLTNQDEAEAVNEDWRALAKIVDRLLLYITIACIFLSLSCVLIYSWSSAPSHQ